MGLVNWLYTTYWKVHLECGASQATTDQGDYNLKWWPADSLLRSINQKKCQVTRNVAIFFESTIWMVKFWWKHKKRNENRSYSQHTYNDLQISHLGQLFITLACTTISSPEWALILQAIRPCKDGSGYARLLIKTSLCQASNWKTDYHRSKNMTENILQYE